MTGSRPRLVPRRRVGGRALVGVVELDAGRRRDRAGEQRVVGLAHPCVEAARERRLDLGVLGRAGQVGRLLGIETRS